MREIDSDRQERKALNSFEHVQRMTTKVYESDVDGRSAGGRP